VHYVSRRKAMSIENVGRKWVDGWNSRDSVAFSMLFAPEGKYIDPSRGDSRGRDGGAREELAAQNETREEGNGGGLL
jgi:hypothetical protein